MMSNQRVVLASSNAGKLRELQSMLAGSNINVLPQSELGIQDAVEDGLSFAENAMIKARHASRESGMPAIADDSGLVVAALQGAPGIYSARYAGDDANDSDNNEKLLSAMQGLSADQRRACFHCALVFMRHAQDPIPIICEGSWYGAVLPAVQGDGGFGYDPLFFVASHHCSSAELPRDVKNKISHRGQALRRLKELLVLEDD
ncbi:MAG: RdgB/HAM1 family non-canonical purine NTP pyrophosphatase [Pseudomonadales bacterium]